MVKVRRLIVTGARNENLELPVRFLKGKQGYSVRKMEKYKWIYGIFIGVGTEVKNIKFRYGIPANTAYFEH
jgi:hypothetical protein